ncbi:STAS domain-containing protein [Pseudonocardia sp. C8]|uniref:STAS domain-containing protein n=1 Tax=Pseudonocardia sp. C8 TaxID=2762759 RepID=UPI0016427E0F|nr:STAS domain-containing protein [Pseudonocardia sp. C8]MBC3194476.1 STAS domain-containing protein [Pseudonocardia sp. C8]
MTDDHRQRRPDPVRVARTGPVLRFERSRHPSGTVVLRAIGSVDDETAPDLCTELGLCAEEGSDVVLDLSGVDFLGTAGLTSLVEARDLLAAEGTQLRILCGGSRPARRALQVTGAMELFEVVDRVPGGPTRGGLFGVPDPDVRLDGRPRNSGRPQP